MSKKTQPNTLYAISPIETILAQLDTASKIPATEKTLDHCGEMFRSLWMAKEVLDGYRTVQPRYTPKAVSGGCFYAAALARNLFGGDLHGNWQHVWIENKNVRIDLTGLADVSLEQATRVHLAMLRRQRCTVKKLPDGQFTVQRHTIDGWYQQPNVDPATFFVHDKTAITSPDATITLAKTISHALLWGDLIRQYLIS